MISPSSEPKTATEIECDLEDDRHREAYRLKKAGMRVETIAKRFGVDRATVYRWINNYKDAYRKTLEGMPVINLISEEVAGLTDIEQQARLNAERTSSEKQKQGFLNTALKAAKARQQLLLDVGILPKAPERLYQVTAEMKPASRSSESLDDRSSEEILLEIIEIWRRSTPLGAERPDIHELADMLKRGGVSRSFIEGVLSNRIKG